MCLSLGLAHDREDVALAFLTHPRHLCIGLLEQLRSRHPRVPAQGLGVGRRRTTLVLGICHRFTTPPGGVQAGSLSHRLCRLTSRLKNLFDVFPDSIELGLEILGTAFCQLIAETLPFSLQKLDSSGYLVEKRLDFGAVEPTQTAAKPGAPHLVRGEFGCHPP